MAVPLAFTSYRVAWDAFLQTRAQEIVETWLEKSKNELELVGVKVFDHSVYICLASADEPEAVQELGQSINERYPQPDDITVQINFSKIIPLSIAEIENE